MRARYSPNADLENGALERPEPTSRLEPLRPALHLAQRLDVGREPGEAVGGVLLALQEVAVDPALAGHAGPDRLGRARQQVGRGADRAGARLQEGFRLVNARGLRHRHRNVSPCLL